METGFNSTSHLGGRRSCCRATSGVRGTTVGQSDDIVPCIHCSLVVVTGTYYLCSVCVGVGWGNQGIKISDCRDWTW